MQNDIPVLILKPIYSSTPHEKRSHLFDEQAAQEVAVSCNTPALPCLLRPPATSAPHLGNTGLQNCLSSPHWKWSGLTIPKVLFLTNSNASDLFQNTHAYFMVSSKVFENNCFHLCLFSILIWTILHLPYWDLIFFMILLSSGYVQFVN